MLHSPPCLPAVKKEIQTENRLSSPRTPSASLPRIEGSQQCSDAGCIPQGVVVAGVVVAAAVTPAAMLVAAVADLQQKHGPKIKGAGERPPLAADIGYPSVTSGPSC